MNTNLGRKGKLTTAVLSSVIIMIVMLVVIFLTYSEVVPEAQAAGDTLNVSSRCASVGCFYNTTAATPFCALNTTDMSTCDQSAYEVPLSGLFGGTGIVFLIVMAALLILVVKSFISKK